LSAKRPRRKLGGKSKKQMSNGRRRRKRLAKLLAARNGREYLLATRMATRRLMAKKVTRMRRTKVRSRKRTKIRVARATRMFPKGCQTPGTRAKRSPHLRRKHLYGLLVKERRNNDDLFY
jgi:hypothetical protein